MEVNDFDRVGIAQSPDGILGGNCAKELPGIMLVAVVESIP